MDHGGGRAARPGAQVRDAPQAIYLSHSPLTLTISSHIQAISPQFDSNIFLARNSLPSSCNVCHAGGDGVARPGVEVRDAPQEAGPAGGQDVGGAGGGRRAQEPRLLRRLARTGVRERQRVCERDTGRKSERVCV